VFKATLSKLNLLTDSVSSIAELIDEGIFKITKDGFSLLAADRAMVAVVDYKLPASAFEKFEVEGENSIGVNIGNFLSILKRASSGDKLTFNLKENKLEILLEGSSRRRFTLPILDLSQEEVPQIDQLEFVTKVELKPSIFQSGIDDAEVVADSVMIEATKTSFGMRAEGDISSAQLELEKGNEALIDLKSETDIKARYPLDYLKKMVKASKIAQTVSLEWGQDYPMKLTFKSPENVSLTFVVAPRVSEE
jgi:proliferating cell nuclear antigen